MATTREIIYRLVAEPDPKYKKVLADFSKAAVEAQEKITKAAQAGGKARTDSAEKELARQRKAEDAANKQRQRNQEREEQEGKKALERAVRETELAEARKQKAHDKAHKEKEKADAMAAKEKEKADARAARAAEERAKAEIAAQKRLEAAQRAAAEKSRKAYREVAEGSVRAGEGMMRLLRAAASLGGDENMKRFVEHLRKAQAYFDLYKGVVDIVMGLSKAYHSVAAAAAAAAAAQAASANAGSANAKTAGVGTATMAPKALGLLKRGGAAAIIALGAGTLLDRAFNKGRMSDAAAKAIGN